MSFKPMLASPADLKSLRYPLLGSPKLDGIRASVVGGRLLTRTLKPVPNMYVRSLLENRMYDGLDGELIVGPPNAEDVYRQTTSGVMSIKGEPDFTYWVFDIHDAEGMAYERRLDSLKSYSFLGNPAERTALLPQQLISNEDQLLTYEDEMVTAGYEGLILRCPRAPYKFGRSTPREGYLLKLKRFEDSEALVLGVVEEMHNGNEATTNELGRTKRSSAKAGKTGKGTMGALQVRDLKTGVEFEIGCGFTAADRAEFFQRPPKIVKYKFFPIGVKDKPRHPVYLGVRDERDL